MDVLPSLLSWTLFASSERESPSSPRRTLTLVPLSLLILDLSSRTPSRKYRRYIIRGRDREIKESQPNETEIQTHPTKPLPLPSSFSSLKPQFKPLHSTQLLPPPLPSSTPPPSFNPSYNPSSLGTAGIESFVRTPPRHGDDLELTNPVRPDESEGHATAWVSEERRPKRREKGGKKRVSVVEERERSGNSATRTRLTKILLLRPDEPISFEIDRFGRGATEGEGG